MVRYEARRWVAQNNKSPTKLDEEKHPTTVQTRRRIDNGRANIFTNSEKVEMENHDDAEFPEPRQRDSGMKLSNQTVSAFPPSETSASKVYLFTSLFLYPFMQLRSLLLCAFPQG